MTTSLKNLFFPRLPKPIILNNLEADRAQRIRNIVASVSTGNVSLQQGAFMTEADVEHLRKNEGHQLDK